MSKQPEKPSRISAPTKKDQTLIPESQETPHDQDSYSSEDEINQINSRQYREYLVRSIMQWPGNKEQAVYGNDESAEKRGADLQIFMKRYEEGLKIFMKSEEDPDLYMKEAATMMREGQSAIPSPERAETEYSLPKSKLEDHKREENKKYLQQLQNPFEERGYKSKELAESPQPKINNTPLAKPFQPKSYQLLSITPVTISFEKIETALCDVMKAGVKADSFDLEEVKKNIAKCASQLHLKKQKDKLVFAKEEGVEMFCKYVLLHYSIPEKEELWKKLVKDSEVGKKNVGNASQI